jgi:hypothetical protein
MRHDHLARRVRIVDEITDRPTVVVGVDHFAGGKFARQNSALDHRTQVGREHAVGEGEGRVPNHLPVLVGHPTIMPLATLCIGITFVRWQTGVVTEGGQSRWDRFWLAFFRLSERASRRATPQTFRQRRETALSRFGMRHPVLGGVVAAVVWGGAMFAVFSALTLFRVVELMAVLWAIGGASFGTAMGWYWSYQRRHGAPPTF